MNYYPKKHLRNSISLFYLNKRDYFMDLFTLGRCSKGKFASFLLFIFYFSLICMLLHKHTPKDIKLSPTISHKIHKRDIHPKLLIKTKTDSIHSKSRHIGTLPKPEENKPGDTEGSIIDTAAMKAEQNISDPFHVLLYELPKSQAPPKPRPNSQLSKMYKDFPGCITKKLDYSITQHGEFWSLNNYIPAAKTFKCHESITFTTHSDFTFLDNLVPYTERWQGPISMSVYAPSTDFATTIDMITYLRDCTGEDIRKFVTFHIIFHMDHTPRAVPPQKEVLARKWDCKIPPPKFENVTTYRTKNNFLYPVNVLRNIAKATAQTYFLFPADVELYPSINFIPDFFAMLQKPDFSKSSKPRVYTFPIFEVEADQKPPKTKRELVTLLKTGKAIPFHLRVCAKCHNQPMSKEWPKLPESTGLNVFHIGKRLPPFQRWEPIYVGSWKEPVYDERISWEGKSDKMTQMHILCLRDYEFHLLDNAFLVHRPGIKDGYKDPVRQVVVNRQNAYIKNKLDAEYKAVFGSSKNCRLPK